MKKKQKDTKWILCAIFVFIVLLCWGAAETHEKRQKIKVGVIQGAVSGAVTGGGILGGVTGGIGGGIGEAVGNLLCENPDKKSIEDRIFAGVIFISVVGLGLMYIKPNWIPLKTTTAMREISSK